MKSNGLHDHSLYMVRPMDIRRNTNAYAGNGASSPAKHRLASHQIKIKSAMDNRSSLGIFAEAGTGKTMIALSWIYDALLSGRIEDALIVCPASLVPSWNLAIEKMTEFEGYCDMDVEIMKSYVRILSLQSVWQASNRTTKHRDGTTSSKRTYRIRDGFEKHWGVIIIDESHNLGGHSSIQTKACMVLSKYADYRYIMTGTPDSGKYEKLYGQINFLQPDRWKSFLDFRRECIRSLDRYFKPQTYFVEHCEELKREYGVVARLRECFDMPSSTETDVPCPIAEPQIYRDFIRMKTDGYGVSLNSSGTAWLKALQVCSGFYINDEKQSILIKNSKSDTILKIIDGINGKVVIFCNFTTSINHICEILTKEGITHYRFDGTVNEPVWQKFQKDDTKCIVVQYQRGGTGIDLFASCYCIFYEMTMRAVLLEQSKARIMRKGQTKPCRYYYLYAPGSIEEKLMRNVRNGMDVSTAMLDEWAREEAAVQTKLSV